VQFLEAIDYQSPGFGDFYDELPLWSAPFGRLLLDRVPLRQNGTILDVGAGTGFLTVELAQRCGPTTQVIAVDPWVAAIERLERKVKNLGLLNVRLIRGGIESVDLADSSVDLIVSNLGLNNLEDPRAALQVCRRVARPGADLMLTTNLVGHMQEFYVVYRRVLEELGATERLPLLDRHIQHRATIESAAALLDSAGFDVIETATNVFYERFIDGSALLRHHFIRLAFVPGWKFVAPPDKIAATFELLERRLNESAEKRGELSLTVPVACLRARKLTEPVPIDYEANSP
jgi:arsenite methyltransferase